MVRFALSLLMALTSVAGVHAQSFYNHNGSIMRLVERGDTIRISYETPREGLLPHGVRPGTVLFEGRLDAGLYLEGMSRIFSSRCEELDYFVYGQYRRDGDFTLNGAAPVLEANGCRVVDNTYEGSNANLGFAWLRTEGQRGPGGGLAEPASGHGSFCVTGVSTSLNMRAGPGAGFAVVGTLPANACGLAGFNRCEGDWCLVERGPDIGWVANQYLRRAP
ncbi:SH3 domain-containing protein [Pelagibacterium montanilacus]|uniref:SH3 domain-containing protein n=1 Tax=Pelagibacterium montanilacus TaxID=2185280 RepID=UPI000F8D1F4A|nr:SH3 domain-containing protein [Pelagibacterium montanilacus]